MKRKSQRARILATASAGALFVTALAAGVILNPVERLDRRHCVADRPPAKTLVVALDVSDALVAAQPREISYQVEQALADLGKGDRIVVLDAAGKPPAEVVPVVDQCVPGDDTNIARNAFRSAVLGPILDHLRDVKTQSPSAESPLVETIVAVAADSSLHPQQAKPEILFITDALQNSALQSAYRQGSEFPKLEGAPLKGIVVRLFLVMNERDLALQPRAVERLNAWLTQAGVEVQFIAPAWLVLAKARYHGGSK